MHLIKCTLLPNVCFVFCFTLKIIILEPCLYIYYLVYIILLIINYEFNTVVANNTGHYSTISSCVFPLMFYLSLFLSVYVDCMGTTEPCNLGVWHGAHSRCKSWWCMSDGVENANTGTAHKLTNVRLMNGWRHFISILHCATNMVGPDSDIQTS